MVQTPHSTFWRGWLLLAVALWMSFAPAAIAAGVPRFFVEPASVGGEESSAGPGLHIYLYANASPLMFSDPSGNNVDYTDFFLDGLAVHRSIGGHFISQKPNRLANYFPLGGILNRSEGWMDNSDFYVVSIGELGLKPDLVDLDTREVYEIKTTRGVVQGAAQLAGYLTILNSFRKPGSQPWIAGVSYIPPPTARGLFRTVKVYGPELGLITYDPLVTNEQIVGASAVVGAAALYRLGAAASIAALQDVYATAILAFAARRS